MSAGAATAATSLVTKVVTLAAAFVIPPETPHREILLLIAFAVVAGTLFIQGLSFPGWRGG